MFYDICAVYTRGPSALVSLPDADLMPATTIGTAPLYLSAPASLELNVSCCCIIILAIKSLTVFYLISLT